MVTPRSRQETQVRGMTDSAWNSYNRFTIWRRSAKLHGRRTGLRKAETNVAARRKGAVRIKPVLAVPLLVLCLLFGKIWEPPAFIADVVNERRPGIVRQFSPQQTARGERAANLDTD